MSLCGQDHPNLSVQRCPDWGQEKRKRERKRKSVKESEKERKRGREIASQQPVVRERETEREHCCIIYHHCCFQRGVEKQGHAEANCKSTDACLGAELYKGVTPWCLGITINASSLCPLAVLHLWSSSRWGSALCSAELEGDVQVGSH